MQTDFIELIGFSAALMSTINQLPQAIKIIRSKDTRSISLYTYVLIWIAVLLWLVYGLLSQDRPLVVSNIVCIIPISYILVRKLLNVVKLHEK